MLCLVSANSRGSLREERKLMSNWRWAAHGKVLDRKTTILYKNISG